MRKYLVLAGLLLPVFSCTTVPFVTSAAHIPFVEEGKYFAANASLAINGSFDEGKEAQGYSLDLAVKPVKTWLLGGSFSQFGSSREYEGLTGFTFTSDSSKITEFLGGYGHSLYSHSNSTSKVQRLFLQFGGLAKFGDFFGVGAYGRFSYNNARMEFSDSDHVRHKRGTMLELGMPIQVGVDSLAFQSRLGFIIPIGEVVPGELIFSLGLRTSL